MPSRSYSSRLIGAHEPCCLKKYGMPWFAHHSLVSMCQCGCDGLACVPDSPPETIHLMNSQPVQSTAPSAGSYETQVFQPASASFRRESRRLLAQGWFSTEVPIQTCGMGTLRARTWAAHSGRLVST